MKRSSVVLLIAALALPAAVFAGDGISGATPTTAEPVDPAKVIEKARKQANEEGRLIFLVYYRSGGDSKQAKAKSVLLTRSRKSITGQFIVKSLKITKDDATWADYSGKVGGKKSPFWVLTKPNGEVLAGGDYETIVARKDGWATTVRDIAKDYPPMSQKTRQSVKRTLKKAEKDLEAERYSKVEPQLKKLEKVWHTPELADECEEFCRKVRDIISELFASAEQLVADDDLTGAVAAYEDLVKKFGRRTETGKTAQQHLEKLLEEHPELSETEEDKGTDADVSDSGPEDKESDDREADREPDPEAKAQGILKLARTYHNNGMVDKAKAKLQACLDTYPDTDAAKEAKELLEQW
ncbi:MAG: tetratricopeptide repeat protein [Planctomycetota bacterium]|jgi:hypothetical protein